MILKGCKFKRKKNSSWEAGLSFETSGDMDNTVIDQYGSKVNRIYDLKDATFDLCLNLTGILELIKL